MGKIMSIADQFHDNINRRLVVNNDRQKAYFIRRGIPSHRIDVVRFEDMEWFLNRKIDNMPKVPSQQMELDFGERFNFWWYDDEGKLCPRNDLDTELDFVNDSDFDDIPF